MIGSLKSVKNLKCKGKRKTRQLILVFSFIAYILISQVMSAPTNAFSMVYENIEEDYTIKKEELERNYRRGEDLIYRLKEYKIMLRSRDIVNFDNNLSLNINLKENKNGYEFSINDNNPLPGKITLVWNDKSFDKGKHYYIFNEEQENYVEFKQIEPGELEILVEGKYLLTDEMLAENEMGKNILLLVLCFAMLGLITHIAINKRYWFW